VYNVKCVHVLPVAGADATTLHCLFITGPSEAGHAKTIAMVTRCITCPIPVLYTFIISYCIFYPHLRGGGRRLLLRLLPWLLPALRNIDVRTSTNICGLLEIVLNVIHCYSEPMQITVNVTELCVKTV
jgi:hypothetical protein